MLRNPQFHGVLVVAFVTGAILAGAAAADKKAIPGAGAAKTPKKLADEMAELQDRVKTLETDVAEVKAALADLRAGSAGKQPTDPDTKPEPDAKTSGGREKVSEALYQRILNQKMTEAEVVALLGPGKPSTRPNIPNDVRELVWSEGRNSITIQFTNGRATGGISEFSTAPSENSKKRRGRAAKSDTSE